MDAGSDDFITLLTSFQPKLYACILSLHPDRTAAHDILQETNLTLWHKAQDFEAGTNFLAWASRIARYHVLNYRRKVKRDRLVFDDSLFEELCERQANRAEDAVEYAELLQKCLKKLPEEQYSLVAERYAPGGSVSAAATRRNQSAGSISQSLYRIREALLNCMSERLNGGFS